LATLDYRTFEALFAPILGGVVVLFSLYLFFRERVVVDQRGAMLDVKLSLTEGRFMARSSAFGVLFFGVILILVPPAWKHYFSPEMLSVTGKIILHEGKTVQGLQNVLVAIIPMKTYATQTLKDGTYAIAIPRGKDEHNYQALAYLSNPNPAFALSELGRVNLEANGQGRFDHAFTRGTK
jgi:hypothetical protein